MSIKSRRPPRGNTQRNSGGPRRSNTEGFAAYTETLRPSSNEATAPPPENTTEPPPSLVNGAGSGLPSASGVIGARGANDEDSAPDSSTRFKEGTAELKAESGSTAPPSLGRGVERLEEDAVATPEVVAPHEETKAKAPTKVLPDAERTGRSGRADRAERRARERGKGGARGRSLSASSPPPKAPPAQNDTQHDVQSGARTGIKDDLGPASSPSGAPKSSRAHRSDSVPASGGAHVDLDERFFSEGIQADGEVFARKQSSMRPPEPEEEIDPKLLLKMHPDVRARRAKFAPIVKWVVLGAVLLGLGGLVKHKIAQGDQETAAREMAEYAATHAPASTTREDNPATAPAPAVMPGVQGAASGEAPVPSALPKPTEGLAAPAEGTEVHEAPVPAVGSSAVAAVASVSPPPEAESAPAKTAAQEKRDCQVFLDRGAFGKAVEAGQRSVAVDPSDGEAWLLLGAAYQSLGRAGDAKRSFSACLKQGKKGPLAECKAMLQ
jgi:hypothetical protein